jgi:predicted dehydrogenase
VYGTRAAATYAVDLQYWNSGETDAHSTLAIQPRGSSQRQAVEFEHIDMYRAELEDWAAAVRSGRPPRVGGPEAMAALAVVWAALESSASGRSIQPRAAPAAAS